MKARKMRMTRPMQRAKAHGMSARGRRPLVCRCCGRRRTRVASSAVGRLTRARSARAGERRRQGKMGKSWPVGWSQERKRSSLASTKMCLGKSKCNNS